MPDVLTRSEIKDAQRLLNRLGVRDARGRHLTVDGVVGPSTLYALRAHASQLAGAAMASQRSSLPASAPVPPQQIPPGGGGQPMMGMGDYPMSGAGGMNMVGTGARPPTPGPYPQMADVAPGGPAAAPSFQPSVDQGMYGSAPSMAAVSAPGSQGNFYQAGQPAAPLFPDAPTSPDEISRYLSMPRPETNVGSGYPHDVRGLADQLWARSPVGNDRIARDVQAMAQRKPNVSRFERANPGGRPDPAVEIEAFDKIIDVLTGTTRPNEQALRAALIRARRARDQRGGR